MAYDKNRKQSNLPREKANEMADLGAIVAQLKQERAKLDKAIEALSGVAGKSGDGGTRKLSAAAVQGSQQRSAHDGRSSRRRRKEVRLSTLTGLIPIQFM